MLTEDLWDDEEDHAQFHKENSVKLDMARKLPNDTADKIRQTVSSVADLHREVEHWKANHATEVRRARVLKERLDMPLERVNAYEKWGEDQRRIIELEEEVERLRDAIEDNADVVSKAMRHAWQLGQTYWQQADSEYMSRNKKCDATWAKFHQLVDETRAEMLSARYSKEPQ